MEQTNLLTIFMTGLVTGGLTCMAVQGGLLTATIASREQEKLKEYTEKTGNALPIIAFLIAKLIAYTGLGLLLGWLGSLVQLSVQMQVFLQIVVVIFMIGTALNMLNVHPIFRYFIIQPPRKLVKFIWRFSKRKPHSAETSRGKDMFAPALLGAFTVFIPCGTTQAMMALAIASANPILGAAILFAFVLGTSPVFFLLGYLTTRLGDVLHERFTKVAATAIILLALFNLNNALALAGGEYTFDKLVSSLNCAISFCGESRTVIAEQDLKPVDTVWIELTDGGYVPNTFTVKRGSKVTMNLINKEGRGCVQAFTIPQFGIQKIVPVGTEETITFIAPDKPGEILFTCSMGMYPGTIKVI